MFTKSYPGEKTTEAALVKGSIEVHLHNGLEVKDYPQTESEERRGRRKGGGDMQI